MTKIFEEWIVLDRPSPEFVTLFNSIWRTDMKCTFIIIPLLIHPLSSSADLSVEKRGLAESCMSFVEHVLFALGSLMIS